MPRRSPRRRPGTGPLALLSAAVVTAAAVGGWGYMAMTSGPNPGSADRADVGEPRGAGLPPSAVDPLRPPGIHPMAQPSPRTIGGTSVTAQQVGWRPYGIPGVNALTASGIPVRAYQAYVAAAESVARRDPTCGLTWAILAGIGRVESNHGRFAGSALSADGRATPPVYGIRLDGSRRGTAVIRDSDGGRLDRDGSFDRAVGPMQFLPQTFSRFAMDTDGDGRVDPQDIDDAALAAANYLCAGSAHFDTLTGRWAAIYRYNHSDSYVSLVLSLARTYATGSVTPFTVPPGSEIPRLTGDRMLDGPASPAGPPPALKPWVPNALPMWSQPAPPVPQPAAPKPAAPKPAAPQPAAPKAVAPEPVAPTPTPTTQAPTPAPTTQGPTPSPSTEAPTPTPSDPAPEPTPSDPAPEPTSTEPTPTEPTPTEPAPSDTPSQLPSETPTAPASPMPTCPMPTSTEGPAPEPTATPTATATPTDA